MRRIVVLLIVILSLTPLLVYGQDRDLFAEYCIENWIRDKVTCEDYIPEDYYENKSVYDQLEAERIQQEGIQARMEREAQVEALRTQFQSDEDQGLYIIIGIVAFIVIASVIVASRKKTPYKDLPRRGFSDSIKEAILRKQNHRCADCNRVLDVVDFDHIDGDKTNNDISNCQALCLNCHGKKSRKEQSESEDG